MYRFITKIKASLKIIRPLNCIIAGFSIFLAGYLSNNYDIKLPQMLFLPIAGILVTAAGNIINDIFDIEIDKINRPQRPLASNILSVKFAKSYYSILVIISIILSSYVNIYALSIVIFSNIIIFFYSYRLKSLPLIGNFTVSFFTGLSFIYGGVAGNYIHLTFLPAFFAFLINFIREIVKDCEDITGDKELNLKTFPILYGTNKSIKLANILLGILILACYYLIYIKQSIIVTSIITFIIILLIYVMQILQKNKFTQASKILKICMLIGIISFLIK